MLSVSLNKTFPSFLLKSIKECVLNLFINSRYLIHFDIYLAFLLSLASQFAFYKIKKLKTNCFFCYGLLWYFANNLCSLTVTEL